MKNLPPIRTENIVTQETGDEILVYDLLTNKAFCLNETSARIYTACGENQTFADLKSKYNFTEDLINLALDELEKNNLLAEKNNSSLNSINRREVIKKIGLTSMVALPVISAIVAPKAVNAASGSNCPVGYDCIPSRTPLCPSNPSGSYSAILLLSSDGTCSGNVITTTSFSCPNNGNTSVDICLRTVAAET